MIDREHRELVGRLRNRWGQDVPSLCNDAADVIERLAIAQSGTQPGLIEAAEWHEAEAARYAKRARFQGISNFHEGCAQHFRARATDRSA